jgi:hypothetical protein
MIQTIPPYMYFHSIVCLLMAQAVAIMFNPARDFLLETPWRIIIPNPNVNSHYGLHTPHVYYILPFVVTIKFAEKQISNF